MKENNEKENKKGRNGKKMMERFEFHDQKYFYVVKQKLILRSKKILPVDNLSVYFKTDKKILQRSRKKYP